MIMFIFLCKTGMFTSSCTTVHVVMSRLRAVTAEGRESDEVEVTVAQGRPTILDLTV